MSSAQDNVALVADMIPGLETVKEAEYSKESLFGYMNGGAELYLEHGFEELKLSELKYNGHDLKAEIYRMESPAMAFGIYSVNIFRCDSQNEEDGYYCETDFQVQACRGEYYINIVNSDGSAEGKDIAVKLAAKLSEMIYSDSFSLKEYLGDLDITDTINSKKLLAGRLSLENNAFSYLEYLEGFESFSLLILEADSYSLLAIRFDEAASISKFFVGHGILEIPLCGEPVRSGDKEFTMTDHGDILLRLDSM
jgi:hypothetical protein